MSDHSVKLGALAPPDGRRDAVHVAVVAVVASQRLAPGAPVGLNQDKQAVTTPRDKALGVVDPYLRDVVEQGEWFWLCLKPGTVTSLRHEWTHPAFPDVVTPPLDPAEAAKQASVAWLQDAARQCGVDYDTMMHRLERDDYINMGENESYKALDYDEFAKHVEIVTGKKEAYPPFSCSC